MIEDDLRAAFARHEPLTPPTGPLRAAIDRLATRRRRRRQRWRAGGAALALLGVLGIGVPLFTPDRSGPPQAAELLGESGRPAPTGAVTILLLGIDSQTSRPPLADSVLLVHIPADRSRPYLVSLPRDLKVRIPGRGTDKLNTAFPFGAGLERPDLTKGYELTRRTVAELTGAGVESGFVLTFSALRTLTDAVDGVPVCLPQGVRSVHTGRLFPAGCQRLDGAASVDLLRQRRGLAQGSQDRDHNARLFAAGLVRQVREQGVLTDPVRLSKLLGAIGPDLAAASDGVTMLDLMRLVPTLRSVDPVGLSLPISEPTGRDQYLHADPALAPEFLTALREDRLGEWAARHPERVDPAG
ncbi:LCP family protein [Micromonospora cremea]|uniref:Cell envelope-related function transcriptional attenuator common domain-containing protein n=1 Tax=Micromonospora cremea TaxID=709881 RepID=A0A1N6A3Y0_9ACTN|nr:LCP family protein [Micromonospora cremea]SIN28732.1 cell envelope-related function transcriptional attenuator common domain-containing protein [Micromonospora cremea]